MEEISKDSFNEGEAIFEYILPLLRSYFLFFSTKEGRKKWAEKRRLRTILSSVHGGRIDFDVVVKVSRFPFCLSHYWNRQNDDNNDESLLCCVSLLQIESSFSIKPRVFDKIYSEKGKKRQKRIFSLHFTRFMLYLLSSSSLLFAIALLLLAPFFSSLPPHFNLMLRS